MTKAKTPIVPHDLLTSLCAIAKIVGEDPKKIAFIQKQLGKGYDLKNTIAFAQKHNSKIDRV